MKPRYDFGGTGVKIIEEAEGFEPDQDLLVQRFVDSSTGIPGTRFSGVHDLRVILVDDEPRTAFVRTPDSGLISNVSMGGSLENISLEEVPEEALEVVRDVDSEMEEYGDRVYSVDLIFDEEGRPWILELNSKPGLAFYGSEEIASWKKPLIDDVVEKLVRIT